MEDQHSLQVGITINHYRIIRVLGSGGFGITYLAEDLQLGMKVVIKEYFPNEFALRKNDSTIIAKISSDEAFAKGKQRFKEEAQVLAKFNHPSIVKILGYFEANSTAYFVMEYEEGIDLAQYLKQENRALSQDEILSILMPILEGLKEVHAHNYLHRDIKPGNILLRKDKSPVLIDFGASKLALGEASKSITSMLTEGYAPLEQYSTDIKQQGAFTDLYAMAAVMYKCITGSVPPSAQTRSYALHQDDPDPYRPLMSLGLKGYDESFLKAVDRALSISAKKRAQNIDEFQKDISEKKTIDASPSPTYRHIDSATRGIDALTKNDPAKTGLIIAFVFVLTLLIVGIAYVYTGQTSQNQTVTTQPTTVESPVTASIPVDTRNAELEAAKKELAELKRKQAETEKSRLTEIERKKHEAEVERLRQEREDIERLKEEKASNEKEELERLRREAAERERVAAEAATKKIRKSTKSKINTKKEKVTKKSVKKKKAHRLYKLRIVTSPRNARVQILNIKRRYRPNIRLKKGYYTIKVSKKGYAPVRKRIYLRKNSKYFISMKVELGTVVHEIKNTIQGIFK